VVEGAVDERGRRSQASGSRYATGWLRYSPYAKDNFQFERQISGWRKLSLVDLRRKEYYSYVTWRDPHKRKRREG
jgi:hypothetical protein